MDDIFNQSPPIDGAARSQPHPGTPPDQVPARTVPTPIPAAIPAPPGYPPVPAARPVQPPTGLAPQTQRATPPAEAATLIGQVASAQPAKRYTLHGIEIRPDLPPADLDRLGARLGRPKANAAAEELVERWADFIRHLRSIRVPFDKVLEVMFAGPDQDAFRKEFSNAGEVTEKDLRRFRTLVGKAPHGGSPLKESGEGIF